MTRLTHRLITNPILVLLIGAILAGLIAPATGATATGATETATSTSTPSNTPTLTATATATHTPTLTATLTPSSTPTETATATVSATATSSTTPTHTPTSTAAPTGTAAPASTATPSRTPTATLPADQMPDRCEANNTTDRACAIPLDAVSGPFTFLPEGDRDHYGVNLGAASTGLSTEITLRGTPGLDLVTTVYRAGSDTPIATFSSPTISTTLQADVTGWIVVRVENRAPTLASGQSYRVEVRRVLPPAQSNDPRVAAGKTPAPDALENNWSIETAAPIAVGTVYDLTFTCPVAGGCAGGDHDYLRVPVKAGVTYVLATFDLGPGVDTALDLFWGDMATPAASNDDLAPDASFVSMLRWRAPGNGEAIVRVGPRTGGAQSVVFEDRAATYRFAVALAGSPVGQQIEARAREQAGIVVPTPAPASSPPASEPAPAPPAPAPVAPTPAAPTSPAPTQASITTEFVTVGNALVITNTVLRLEPGATGTAMEPLPAGSVVTLIGRASGLWVLVKPVGGILAGWVDYRTLRALAEGEAAPTPAAGAAQPGQPAPITAPGSGNPQPTAAPPTPALQVTALDDLPLPPAQPAQPARALTVAVTVQEIVGEGQRRPAPGELVQLVDAFGRVLAEANTDAAGAVSLQRAVAPWVAVSLRLPDHGIETPVDLAQPNLTIAIPTRGDLS